jgi:hypothetical protein
MVDAEPARGFRAEGAVLKRWVLASTVIVVLVTMGIRAV